MTLPRTRVVVVAASCRYLGGQAIQAGRLVEGLAREPSIDVRFQPIDPDLPGVFGALQRVRYARSAVTWPVYYTSLAWRARQCDVVHVFAASYLSFVVSAVPAVLIARQAGRKVVLNYHSGEAEDHLTRWPRALRVVRMADEVVVPSGYLVDVFARFGVRARPIYNTVDFDRYRFRPRSPLEPVFLSNRNLEPMYDVGSVLRAFARIQAAYPGAQLLVAGDGSERVMLHRLAGDLRLTGVKFLGKVPQDKMPELYDAAHIYLNASIIDNMPLSILEAFSSGLPVVTTNAGGIPYLVRDRETGLLAPCKDHDRLAACACELLQDAGLVARLADNARRACSAYTWESVGPRWVGLYHELAGRAAISGRPE
jgi:glycosyltransferase involved in cell wall biosynthesis